MALHITSSRVGPAWVIELDGGLDSTTAEKLDAQVQTALDAGETFLIFDLTKLNIVSSAGLRVFMLARQRLLERGRVRFAGLPAEVRKTFEVVNLNTYVELYDSVTDALVAPPR
jgi:anti-sigma B factor antagonist